MRRIRKALLGTVLPVAAITLALFVALDFFAGSLVLAQLSKLRDLDARFRTRHDIYHHALSPNYDGPASWGGHATHRICIDAHGFKGRCGQQAPPTKTYDIAFIGDSFTEGVGLPYEDTFVGKIADRLPRKTIVNLAAVSYAPSIYLAKIRYLLEQGFRFKQVVVYVDVNDIQDEALFYRYDAETGAVLDMDPDDPDGSLTVPRIKRWARDTLPMSYQGYWWVASRLGLTAWQRFDASARAVWTFDIDAKGYGAMGARAAVDKSLRLMGDLHELLRQHGIRLSVGVYPWPVTLRKDTVDSRQVAVWQQFCAQRCEYFFNAFPAFFRAAREMGTESAIEKLFIGADVHHLPTGTELIAQDFLEHYRTD